MEELLMALESKEREIVEFLKMNTEEREKLIARLNDMDLARQGAEEDLRRVRRAREALQTPSDELVSSAPTSMESMGMQNPLPSGALRPKVAYTPAGF